MFAFIDIRAGLILAMCACLVLFGIFLLYATKEFRK